MKTDKAMQISRVFLHSKLAPREVAQSSKASPTALQKTLQWTNGPHVRVRLLNLMIMRTTWEKFNVMKVLASLWVVDMRGLGGDLSLPRGPAHFTNVSLVA